MQFQPYAVEGRRVGIVKAKSKQGRELNSSFCAGAAWGYLTQKELLSPLPYFGWRGQGPLNVLALGYSCKILQGDPGSSDHP